MAFTPDQRRRLAIKGKALTPEERRDCCQIVRPETILTWSSSGSYFSMKKKSARAIQDRSGCETLKRPKSNA